ncbi:YraN family protein [Umezawaea sp. Da 62-37]|uniref:YraN family protein n=1 Tax=Umezawaea sp. Da 62-37 TaxID=3075927 RepID=UPI0028F6F212|nr:YraN family protein [Umezawaea sp. Da 62-37]WNV89881.1 YraN family protein [Umezawaea sp. Da 62-37]
MMVEVAQRAGRDLGKEGEDLACEYLERLGLVVLSRNWTCREGELDIVATDGNLLVVCEVKSRSGVACGSPLEAVTPEKLHRMRRVTQRWLMAYRVGWVDVRYDAVSVLWPLEGEVRLHHLKGL